MYMSLSGVWAGVVLSMIFFQLYPYDLGVIIYK